MRSRIVLLVLTLSLATAGLLAGPGLASASNCSNFHGRLAVKGFVRLYVRGSTGNLNKYYYTCVGRRGKVFKLPGQDGGDTAHLGTFAVGAGSYIAWSNLDVEEASPIAQATVWSMTARTGRVTVNNVPAWPNANDPALRNSNVLVDTIVQVNDGSLAWLANLQTNNTPPGGQTNNWAVVRIGASGTHTTLALNPNLTNLDNPGDGSTVTWEDNGAPMSAPLKGT